MTNAMATKAIQPQMAVLRCCALQRPARAANVLACTQLLLEEEGRRTCQVRVRTVPSHEGPNHADHWRLRVGIAPWVTVGFGAGGSGRRPRSSLVTGRGAGSFTVKEFLCLRSPTPCTRFAAAPSTSS